MCEVRTKSIQPFTSYRYYYDFIMSRTASLNVYYWSFQSRGAMRPSIIYALIYLASQSNFFFVWKESLARETKVLIILSV